MQLCTIPKPPNQNIHEKVLSDLREDDFRLFAMEYTCNDTDISPSNNLEYYSNTLEHDNEDYDTGINNMFLNNLDPTYYAMQMHNTDVLTHAQMKRLVDADKFFEEQKLEIEGLSEIGTF
jgi:hypothetical protein